jgi:hypothetical protein
VLHLRQINNNSDKKITVGKKNRKRNSFSHKHERIQMARIDDELVQSMAMGKVFKDNVLIPAVQCAQSIQDFERFY